MLSECFEQKMVRKKIDEYIANIEEKEIYDRMLSFSTSSLMDFLSEENISFENREIIKNALKKYYCKLEQHITDKYSGLSRLHSMDKLVDIVSDERNCSEVKIKLIDKILLNEEWYLYPETVNNLRNLLSDVIFDSAYEEKERKLYLDKYIGIVDSIFYVYERMSLSLLEDSIRTDELYQKGISDYIDYVKNGKMICSPDGIWYLNTYKKHNISMDGMDFEKCAIEMDASSL